MHSDGMRFVFESVFAATDGERIETVQTLTYIQYNTLSSIRHYYTTITRTGLVRISMSHLQPPTNTASFFSAGLF